MGDDRSVFTVDFGDGQALAARVTDREGLTTAVHEFGLNGPRPVVVVVGGAGGLTDADLEKTRSVVARALLPVIAAHDAVVVDGGTDSGVMRLMGRVRDGFPLVGVAAEQTVILPGQAAGPGDPAPLESHHSHFLLVPGVKWGDEAPWLAAAATVLAAGARSVTLLINGGAIAVEDAFASLHEGREVVVVAGTGRTADRITAAQHGDRDDEQVNRLADHPAVHIADGSDPDAVRKVLTSLLRPHG